jgi:hypothetical protein
MYWSHCSEIALLIVSFPPRQVVKCGSAIIEDSMTNNRPLAFAVGMGQVIKVFFYEKKITG